jgi:hypothetical protein
MFASSGLMFAVDKIFAGFANQTWRSSLWISELTLWTGQVNVTFLWNEWNPQFNVYSK